MTMVPEQSTLSIEADSSAAQLEQAQRELQALSYAISHDLRAPVRAIAGFSQALKDQAGNVLDDTAHHYLQRIEQSTQRLSAMIDGLLSLSRLNQSDMHCIDVDLSVMCAQLALELQHQFQLHPVRFTVMPAIHAQCDPHLMRIALQAILHNAWKFTQECADPQVSISASKHGDQLNLSIVDNGIGFEMRYADRIGVPFQHLQSSSTLHGLGTGMAQAQRVITRHAGTLQVMSKPGIGTTIQIVLPAAHTSINRT